MSGRVKLGVTLLTALLLYKLLTTNIVWDAILNFSSVGAVPGTHITLTPNQMFIVLILLLLGSGLIIFRKQAKKGAEHLRTHHLEPQVKANFDVAVTPVTKPEPVVVTLPKPPGRQHVFWRTRVVPALKRFALAILIVVYYVLQAAAKLYEISRPIVRRGWQLAISGARQAWIRLKQFWRWLKPRIHQFDRWLEKKLKKNEGTAIIISILTQCNRTLQRWRAATMLFLSKHISED